ncbi:MAG: hypothetical protein GY797_36240, partial [Deltaproteobacteria bacterium]|nr:hypothetical protein [Deltaproteobacteria bacterium]
MPQIEGVFAISFRRLILPIFLAALTLSAYHSYAESPLPDNNSQATEDSASSIYIDRLIDEDIVEEIELEEYEDSRLGPGSIGMTYRYYRNDTDNTETMSEHGAQLRWQQETISNGSFELLAQGLISNTRDDEKIKDGRVLFRQQEYVLNDSLKM